MSQSKRILGPHIGLLVREAREKRHFTLKEVAQELGMSEERLTKVEGGQIPMTAAEWYFFCQLVNIHCDSLQYGTVLWKSDP